MKKATIKAIMQDKVHNNPVVLLELEGTHRVVPIWIGACEAWALTMTLEQIEFPRPLTHDLIISVAEALDAKLERAVIRSIKDGVFLSTLVLKDLTEQEEASPFPASQLIEIDARPSDCIVIAAKTGIPIYITSEVILEASMEFQIRSEGEESEEDQFKAFIRSFEMDDLKKYMDRKKDEN